MTAPSRKFIETRLIRLDGDTQPREQIDEATVAAGVRHFTPILAPFRKVPPAPARV